MVWLRVGYYYHCDLVLKNHCIYISVKMKAAPELHFYLSIMSVGLLVSY